MKIWLTSHIHGVIISKCAKERITLEGESMSYEKVMQAKEIIVGTKQTLKALEDDTIKEVIIANDADLRIVQKVKMLADKKGVPITYVESMRKLGKACKIDVGAATVGITK